MNLGDIRNNMEVYHEQYGFCKVLRKRGMWVVVERLDRDPPDDEDDEEDELEVRAHTLTRRAHMSPALRQMAMERKAKREKEQKEKELREQEYVLWKASLPELPNAVQNHLDSCCKSGMMAFFNFINTDPDALDKLKKVTHYLLREQIVTIEEQLASLEQELETKRTLVEMTKKLKLKSVPMTQSKKKPARVPLKGERIGSNSFAIV